LTITLARTRLPRVPRVEVVRTFLELDTASFRPAPSPDPRARVERILECPPSFFRYLYAEVGRSYHWVDRLGWTDEQHRARLADPAVSLHLLTVAGGPAGYFELARGADAAVEIAYFGLLPEFLGRGLGKFLLTEAVRAALATAPRRVWLHTCTLDDPAALPNYLARGFRPVRTETYEAEVDRERTASRSRSPRG
jgi:GNAT superfamily N-acetyltransferase